MFFSASTLERLIKGKRFACSIQGGCIAVAVLLHYFFLAAFFLMLAEGVQLVIFVFFVLHVRRKSESAFLIASGWGKLPSLEGTLAYFAQI